MAGHMNKQYRMAAQNLKKKMRLIMNFSENYSVTVPKEVQSLHWISNHICCSSHMACHVSNWWFPKHNWWSSIGRWTSLVCFKRKHSWLSQDISSFKTLKGTRSSQEARSVGNPSVIQVWKQGCVSEFCLCSEFADCINASIVDPLTLQHLICVQSLTLIKVTPIMTKIQMA